MKYKISYIKQLLIKHGNNKSAVARELGMDRANLNRYLRRMYAAGVVNEKYNVNKQEIIDKANYDYCISVFGSDKVHREGNSVTCYLVEGDDEDLSVDELEKAYGGFND